MDLRLSLKDKRPRVGINPLLLLQALIVISACAVTTSAQRPSTPGRDMVLSITRKEMDRMLHLKPLPPLKNDPVRRAALKQIGEDFKEMQNLNNKMMGTVWAQPELDYRYVSDMVAQIRVKAARLKANLSFPEVNDEAQNLADAKFSDDQKFRAGLLLLDQRIMSFANNPLFQKPDVVEVELANKATRDLEAVIEITGKLKKGAAVLGKAAKSSP